MGFFTWTLANRKTSMTKYGDFRSSCKLGYGGFGAVYCPDGTVIQENSYDGYGIFGGKDVYELVVDWNRDSLSRLNRGLPWGHNASDAEKEMFQKIADALQAGRDSDCPAIAASYANAGKVGPYLRTDWKRCLGIRIACGDNNGLIPCPIKIIDSANPRKRYADLPPSISCQ